MDKEAAKQEIKERIEEYLQSKGINTSKPFQCLNPKHNDTHPSMCLDKNRYKVHCFSCGADYDIFDLMALDYGLTGKSLFLKAYDFFGFPRNGARREANQLEEKLAEEKQERDFTDYFREAHNHIAETDYLQERGLSRETIERFGLGYQEFCSKSTGGVTWKAIIIPTSNHSFVVRNTDPQADIKDRYRKQGPNHLFNMQAFINAEKPIFVVEGEIDALSIVEAGGEAVALGSVANVRLLVRILQNVKPSYPLMIALDNDEAGEKAANVLEKGLEGLGIPFYRFNPAGEYKDANEALRKDRDGFIAAVRGAERLEQEVMDAKKEEYLKSSAVYYLQAFMNGIDDSVNTPYISTGFQRLDQALDGGLYEGLYICGAISSLGKTTLMTQIADQIAQEGQDVLIFSLEMARNEIMAKSISRHTLVDVLANKGDIRNAKTARGITVGERYGKYSPAERELIQRAVMAYGAYAGHIFIEEGVGSIGAAHIRERVDRHTAYTGRAPVVIVDYLQIMAPHNEQATDKQNTDKAVMELKRISRDYKIPVIAISSFNRANYREAVTMEAFKESGALEYSSDVLIGLQLMGAGKKDFDATAEKMKDPRQIELVILKNRNGRTGDKITMKYYPLFNYFEEIDL